MQNLNLYQNKMNNYTIIFSTIILENIQKTLKTVISLSGKSSQKTVTIMLWNKVKIKCDFTQIRDSAS